MIKNRKQSLISSKDYVIYTDWYSKKETHYIISIFYKNTSAFKLAQQLFKLSTFKFKTVGAEVCIKFPEVVNWFPCFSDCKTCFKKLVCMVNKLEVDECGFKKLQLTKDVSNTTFLLTPEALPLFEKFLNKINLTFKGWILS